MNISPFNPSTQTIEVNPMVNHYVQFQSALFSFRNNALFIGGRKATKQQLVPLIARAKVQLEQSVLDAVSNGRFSYAERCAGDLVALLSTTSDLNLTSDVAYHIARNTPYRA
jgi:regulator of sigma D